MQPVYNIIIPLLLLISITQSCTSKKSTDWRKMDCGLYMSPSGDIGFASIPEIANVDKSELEDEEIPNYFLTTFNQDDTTQLKYVIDTLSFLQVGPTDYIDKNFSYYHYPNSDGGYFYRIIEDEE